MSKKGQNINDATYKLFFGHKEAIADLLQDFVQDKLLTQFDLTTLERYPDTHINRNKKERREDLIWRLQLKNGRWCYIYILCEFQSQNDYWMAVRILEYVAVFANDLIRNKVIKKGQKLPLILPVVLYNGKPKWTPAVNLTDIWEEAPELLRPFQPQQSYFLVDEGRLHSKDLQNKDSLATLLFSLERVKNTADLLRVVTQLNARLKAPEYIELRKIVSYLVVHVILKRLNLTEQKIPEVIDLQEVETMLESTVISWTKQWKKEGRAEGRAEGLEEGRSQGLAEGLTQGRTQGQMQERQRTVNNMLKLGFSLQDIASALGLPLENVQTLLKQN